MKRNAVMDLPVDYALVLQQVSEDGQNELDVLSETLNIRRSRLMHIVGSLRKKGLILIERSNMGDAWIRLSSRGRKVTRQIWPERMAFA